MQAQLIFAFFAYFAVLFTIGLVCHRRQRTAADFIMGNRSLNYWVTALSAHASDMSSWLFMAFPAALFIGGLPGIWIGGGLIIGMFLNWQLVATRLRIQTEKYESYTLPTYFEKRFGDTSGIIRMLTAAMTIIFITAYLSAGLIAMGYLLESLFGLNYFIGLSVAMAVAMTYTFIGGYYTVAKVDQFQAIFLLIMIVLVPVAAFFQLPDGFETIFSKAEEANISLHLFTDGSFENILAIFFLIFGWGLGYFGQPHIVTKFMGIKCPDELRKSKYVGMSWLIITIAASTAVGIIGIGYFNVGPQNPELVFVEMVKTLFNPLVAGFILCGVLAANISTMDSQILVCASVLSEDFYKMFFKKKATQRDLLLVSRIGVIAISVISLVIAFMKNATVLESVLYAWSGLGCSFGPLILMSLFSKSTNKYGAIAGIIVGGTVAGIWPTLNPYVSVTVIPAMLPGFSLSLLSIYGVSKLTEKAID